MKELMGYELYMDFMFIREGGGLNLVILDDNKIKLRNKMKLIFVGRILDEKYFRKLKIISRGKQNIEFIGELARENILKLYNSSDLFVCSSLDETGPLTLVEAVSNFVPIITTKVGLVPEVFTNLKDALMLGSRKPESLKNAIELLFRDIKLREKLKENAYQNFIKNLTIDSYTARVEEIMQEVLDR